MGTVRTRGSSASIWWFALGYFACYAPYSALTKALSRGALPGMSAPLDGFALLPVTTLASLASMFAFLAISGWWRYAGERRVGRWSVPWPTRWTFLSGLATGAIIATTTLAYTFDGVSIVFVMLLMRGGVLVLAPIVDAMSRRRVRWFSWAGLALSLAALLVAFAEDGGYEITVLCAFDVAIYLAAYFVRLRFMSRIAKSERTEASTRYFVEEQMVATPAIVLALALYAALGAGTIASALRDGFVDIWAAPGLGAAVLAGVLSQGTGVFGGLILLDGRENTFCVPVNRVSSILAGVVASFALAFFVGADSPSGYELAGAGLVAVAIAVLAIPSWIGAARS